MARIFLLLLSLAPSLTMAGEQNLANECYRGFIESCKQVRDMNIARPYADKLRSECIRGIESSCKSLNALTGEPIPTPDPRWNSSN